MSDVATGTGVWLQDIAASPEFSRPGDSEQVELLGFDVSPQQIPPAKATPSNMRLVLHDITEPFPSKFQGRFDLVNVRLLSYTVKVPDL